MKLPPELDERLHDVVRFLLAAAPVVGPEGHGAQGNPGDQQPRFAKESIFHAFSPLLVSAFLRLDDLKEGFHHLWIKLTSCSGPNKI